MIQKIRTKIRLFQVDRKFNGLIQLDSLALEISGEEYDQINIGLKTQPENMLIYLSKNNQKLTIY